MAAYLQRDARGPHFMIECACCGMTLHGKPNQSYLDVEMDWRKRGVTGSFNGRKEHICNLCIEEANGRKYKPFWRW